MKTLKVAAAAANKLALIKEKIQATPDRNDESEESDNADRSSDSDVDRNSDSTELSNGSAAEEDTKNIQRSRKRRRMHQGEDLESAYLNRIAEEEAKEEHHRQAMRQVQNGRPGRNQKRSMKV